MLVAMFINKGEKKVTARVCSYRNSREFAQCELLRDTCPEVTPPPTRYHLGRSLTGTFLMERNEDSGAIICLPSSNCTDILPLTGKETFLIFGTTSQYPSICGCIAV